MISHFALLLIFNFNIYLLFIFFIIIFFIYVKKIFNLVIECDKRCYGCDYNKYNCTTCVGKYRVASDCLCKTGTYELGNE